MKKFTTILTLVALLAQNAFAISKTGEDSLLVAKPGSSANKTLKLGTGALQFDTTQSKLRFAHDGATFKDIGSGGGSFRNYLDGNPDADGGTLGWTTYDDSSTFAPADVSTGADTITVSGWAQPDGTPVSFVSGTTLPAGLSAGTTYYTINTSGTTFKVSATLGGSVVDITSQGTGTHTVMPGVPVDGVGGSPGITWTASSSSPIRGTKSFLWTHGATNQSGQGVCYPFTIDRGDLGKALTVNFEYENASGTYVSNTGSSRVLTDIQAEVIDVTAGNLIPVVGKTVPGSGTGILNKFSGQFQTHITDTSYKFCLHQALPSQSAYTVKFDSFQVGPDTKTSGVPATDWVSYPVTIVGFGTATNIQVSSRRVGDTLFIRGSFSAGTPTGVNATLSLGYNGVNANVSIDLTKDGQAVTGYWNSSGSSSPGRGGFYSINSTTIGFLVGNYSQGSGSAVAANGTSVAFNLSVPISGWSSNTVMSSDADTRVIAAKYTSSGQTVSTSDVPIVAPTVEYDTHAAYNTSTGLFTVPVSGKYKISAGVVTGASGSGTIGASYFLSAQKNGSTITEIDRWILQNTNSIQIHMSGSTVVDAKAGDTLAVSIARDSAAPSLILAGDSQHSWVAFEHVSGPAKIAANELVAASYYQNSSQTGFSARTVINFDTAQFDTHGICTVGASFHCTAPVAGKYRIHWNVTSGNIAWTQGWSFATYLYKNGSQAPGNIENLQIAQSSATYRLSSQSSYVLDLAAGDYVDIRADATGSQIPLPNTTYFSIERLGF